MQTFKSLSYRDYRTLWIGILVAASGQWMEQVAIGWLMLDLTDSPLMVAAAQGCRAVPALLAAPLGGILADRVDRRRVIGATQLVAALLATTMAVLTGTEVVRPWHIFAIVAVFGSAWSLNNPSRHALIPDLVPKADLMNAVAVNATAFNVSRVLGPAIGGALIATLGIDGVFSLAASLYLLVFASTFLIRQAPQQGPAAREPMLRSLRDGVAYLRANRTMLYLLLLAFIPVTLGMPYIALLPVFARDVLGRGASSLAVLYAFMGVGALAFTLALASMGNYRKAGMILFSFGLGFGAGLVAFGLSRNFALSCGLAVITGGCSQIYMAITMTLVQTSVSDEMRGRVMSLLMMQFGLTPLGTLLMGAVAQVWSAPAAAVLMGSTVFVALAAAMALMPQVRRLDPGRRFQEGTAAAPASGPAA